MNIIENINERLSLADEDFASGGEQAVAQLVEKSPIKLPEDYIEFLRRISGSESGGIEFIVDDIGASICIWDAQTAIQNYEDDKEFNSYNKDLLDMIWLIGNDLGDLVFFYGEGKDGFGLYREEMGSLVSVDGADKIADTLTDFLVNGTGIDVAISL